ncbi:hypothetical protein DFH06DRAFT_1151480 [Mycena polygramma]|nr:hypothetical protein DFH06DRAFT_1151480 [Mycena polygramma]
MPLSVELSALPASFPLLLVPLRPRNHPSRDLPLSPLALIRAFIQPPYLVRRTVTPHRLLQVIKAGHCPVPTCFCLRASKYVNPILNSEFEGKHAFAFVVDNVLAGTDGQREYFHYPRHGSRKLPPASYSTVLERDLDLLLGSGSSSNVVSPTSIASSSSSNGWSGVHRLLNYRREAAAETIDPLSGEDPFAQALPTYGNLVPLPEFGEYTMGSIKQVMSWGESTGLTSNLWGDRIW